MEKTKMNLVDLLSRTTLPNTNTNGVLSVNHTTQDKVYIESIDILNKLKQNDPRFYIYASDFALASGAFQNQDNGFTYSPMRGLSTGNYLIRFWGENNQDLTYKQIKPCPIRPKIRIDVDKYLQARKSDPNFGKIDDSRHYTAIMEFGEFPQTYVGNIQNGALDHKYENSPTSFTSLNKEYISRIDAEFHKMNITYAKSFQIGNDPTKYVLIDNATPDSTYISFNNGKDRVYKGGRYWFRVKPIEWRILNWDQLPKTINPNGSGEENTIILESVRAFTGVMPYNSYYGHISNHDGKHALYQNSLVRAYLNGYNIYSELLLSGNGHYPDRSDYNFDMTNHNLLKEAFTDMELEMIEEPIAEEKTIEEKVKDHITNKKRVKILKNSLSIDDQLRYYINNRRPVMLHGKSGIGKSRRVADIDPDYFLLTLRNGMMPEEILGKECPNPSGAGTKWYAPSWYNELCEKCKEEPNKNHILFIDELTNVNEYEQSLVYHIVLNHSLGVTHGKLPENCVVVAAGNSKDESNSAYNMSEPLFRRFHGHIYLPLDTESFLEWGSEPRKENPEQLNIHPIISRYIATYPKHLYSDYDPEKEGENFAVDPRAWEQVSDMIYDNDDYLIKELLENKLGDKISEALLTFAEKDFITIEDILEDNYNSDDIPSKLDEQYALALSLRTANEQEIKKVRKFISRNLSGETLAKFDFVWVGNNPERAMIVAESDMELENEEQSYSESTNTDNKQLTAPLSNYIISPKDMTLQEFFIKNELMFIYCESKTQAALLKKAILRLDCERNNYNTYFGMASTEYSCYANDHRVCSLKYSQDKGYPIYDFNQIDFSDLLSYEEIAKAGEKEQDLNNLINQTK